MRRVAVVLLVLGVAGCGGSSEPGSVARTAWAGQARAICSRAEADSKRMVGAVEHKRLGALAELDELARRQGALDGHRMSELRRLARPADDAGHIDELLDRIEAADATLVPLADAAHTDALDDDRAIDARLARMAPALKRLAAQLGVAECVPNQIRRA